MMARTIGAKELRDQLEQVVRRVRRGERITVLYRSRPVFKIVPMGSDGPDLGALEEDPIFGAKALGRSADGNTAEEHDKILYGK